MDPYTIASPGAVPFSHTFCSHKNGSIIFYLMIFWNAWMVTLDSDVRKCIALCFGFRVFVQEVSVVSKWFFEPLVF